MGLRDNGQSAVQNDVRAMFEAVKLRLGRFAFVSFANALFISLAGQALFVGALRAETNTTVADSAFSARDLHVWGRFGVGTWKQARIISETLNEKGEVVDTTTTETKTTLVKATAQRLTLRIE